MGNMKITKRSIVIAGHKKSVTLEDPFWDGLKVIARARNMKLSALVAELEPNRQNAVNFSSSLRLFVLNHYMTLARDRGDALAKPTDEPQAPYDAGPSHE
jgi:predicted DNA-binding ribbon-helix-helix protein